MLKNCFYEDQDESHQLKGGMIFIIGTESVLLENWLFFTSSNEVMNSAGGTFISFEKEHR
jgi:hypothetical protein